MTLNPKCPACGKDLGLARKVSTVPKRPDIMVVLLVCEACAHEWSVERESLDLFKVPTPSQ